MDVVESAATVARVNILGVGISPVNLQVTLRTIARWIATRERRYVNCCTVHTVMEARGDERLRAGVNHSGLSVPDGMPLVWLSRMHGHRTAGRVYGPDLMLALCDRGQVAGHRHFFYGGAPGVAERLARNLRARYPDLVVAGTHSPPFRPAAADESASVVEAINSSGADIVWVGLGTPKQDYWMARHRERLSAPVLIGVGAAFDLHAGLLRQAPVWMRRVGLEWMFRLVQEPRRLAGRYLVYNPLFVASVVLQATGLRPCRMDPPSVPPTDDRP